MQRAWLREFNSLGMQLRPQAAKLLTEFLEGCEDPMAAVENIVENTKRYLKTKRGGMVSIVDGETLREVLECIIESGQDAGAKQNIDGMDLGDGIQVHDATTDVQAYEFRRTTKEWIVATQKSSVFSGCDAKAKIYHERYHLLLQRTLLEGKLLLEEEVVGNGIMGSQRVLTKVESLKGNPGDKITFGLISRVPGESERRWIIEDLHAVFPVELEEKDSDHLMTEGSFVIAEGYLDPEGKVFIIRHLDVPPAVPRRVTLEKDLVPRQVFGGNLSEQQLTLLQESEPGNTDGFYVTLCEVHLDSAKVLDRLRDLFQGYEQASPPTAYVFMGSFCSKDFVPTVECIDAYKDGFDRLKMIMRGLVNHVTSGTRFIFIPGPKDPGINLLPCVPLPSYLTASLDKEVPNVIFASNPCRIHHFSKELLFFRHDVLRFLRRNEILPLRDPETGGAASLQHARFEMVRFLMDQAHLVPLPLESTNVLWSFDHVLRLYPLPDAIFIGGVSQPFDITYQECKFCSVGPFNRDAEFYAYHPIKEELEPCAVPDPDA